jgi:hypothetical protein
VADLVRFGAIGGVEFKVATPKAFGARVQGSKSSPELEEVKGCSLFSVGHPFKRLDGRFDAFSVKSAKVHVPACTRMYLQLYRYRPGLNHPQLWVLPRPWRRRIILCPSPHARCKMSKNRRVSAAQSPHYHGLMGLQHKKSVKYFPDAPMPAAPHQVINRARILQAKLSRQAGSPPHPIPLVNQSLTNPAAMQGTNPFPLAVNRRRRQMLNVKM